MPLPSQPEMLPLILKDLETQGYLGEKEIENIALQLRIPSSSVYGFISQFSEFPRRSHRVLVRVCTGPACALKGGREILAALREKVPENIEVIDEVGLPHFHVSPALCIEPSQGETRLRQGLDLEGIDGVIKALATEDYTDTIPAEDAILDFITAPPGSGAGAGRKLSGQKDSLHAWARDLIERAFGDAEETARKLLEGGTWSNPCGSGLDDAIRQASGKITQPPLLVCDMFQDGTENSADYATTLLKPGEVVLGAALAAAACRAQEIVFYVSWNDVRLGKVVEDAVADLLSGVGVRTTIFKGPSHIPSSRDIAIAAMLEGMMLWRAASYCGWGGARVGGRCLVVLPAGQAVRLSRAMAEDAPQHYEDEGRLMSLAGCLDRPRLLRIPHDAIHREQVTRMVTDLGIKPKAIQAVGGVGDAAGPLPFDDLDHSDIGDNSAFLLLDTSVCMVRWAEYLAERAARECCGGCVPGRSAPRVCVQVIRAILRGEAKEPELSKLEALLGNAGKLALCPRLEETLGPVLACVTGFKEEFISHASEGTCWAGSCLSDGVLLS